MSAAVRSIAHLPAAIVAWRRRRIPGGRLEGFLALLLGLTLGLGAMSHAAVARLGREIEQLNRTGVSSLQLSNEIVRRTLSTSLRAYQALARAEIASRPGYALTEVEMLVDSLSRILQQNFGSDSWRLVWLQEIRTAKEAYVAALEELALAAAETGEIDPYLFDALGSKGDVLIRKAEAFQRVLSEEIALRAREIERRAGLARRAVALGTGAALTVGVFLAGAVARRARERDDRLRKAVAQLEERLRALEVQGGFLEEAGSRLEEHAAQIERALLVGGVYREIARSGLERNKEVVEASRAAHEQCVHSVAQLQERVDRLALAVRGLIGIADQASMLALRARLEAERWGNPANKLAAIALEIERLTDRGVASGDQISQDLARVKDAVDSSASSLAKTLASLYEAAHRIESLSASLAAIEESSEQLDFHAAAVREGVRLGAPLRTGFRELIGAVREVARRIGAEVR